MQEFIETREFQKRWKELGLTQEDLHKLQLYLLSESTTAPIMQGTGGVRKIRWSRNKGKSGGVRVLYIEFLTNEQIYLITVFGKNEKVNLSDAEKHAIKVFVKIIKGDI